MKALEIRDLRKSFRSNFLFKKYEILKAININVEKGQIYGFLGPNGAGKTITIKCILGLLFPDSGQILINNKPATNPEIRQILGFLPEYPFFYDYLTAKEFLHFSAMLFSIPSKKASEVSKKLIKQVGLEGKENIKLKNFSKGMLQRIGFAQALINDPDIVILDEPFSGLDPIGRKELRDIVIALKNSGKTVFFSSHILQDMELIADKVGIIFNGNIIKEGKLSDLVSHSVQYYDVIFSNIDKKKVEANKINFVCRDESYIVRCQDINTMNNIIEFVILNKGKILSVTPIKMTLEDIFLKEIK
ncbi:MAG: ABC transporter ATP-binding protein [Candidatus Aminicenantes bacterium]|nr:ABC transporter ATP-binding protein [Candidatus Aminicenantes bacterium]